MALNEKELEFYRRLGILDIKQGSGIVIDKSDPRRPKISATGGGGGGGDVSTVNGVGPDGSGNVELNLSDIVVVGSGLRDDNGTIKLGSLDLTDGLLTEDMNLVRLYNGTGYSMVGIGEGQILNSINSGDGRTASITMADNGSVNNIAFQKATSEGTQTINFNGTIGDIITISDTINNKGIEYAEDYSTNWTDHSLVTKKWVTDNFSGGTSLTFQNGLRENGGTVELGFDFTSNEGELTTPLWLILGDALTPNTPGVSFSINDETTIGDGHNVSMFSKNAVNEQVNFSLGTGSQTSTSHITFQKTVSNLSQILSFAADNSIVIGDDIDEKGAVYASDYSTNGKLDPRWIPDWGAVTAYADSIVPDLNNYYNKTESDNKYATAAQGALADTAVQPAALSGYVPTSRTVNGKALTANISLTNTDVGAAATSHTHNASDINAGTLAIARIPTGTTSTTVSLGNHTHSTASTSVNGFMSSTDKTKLDGLFIGAYSNIIPITTNTTLSSSTHANSLIVVESNPVSLTINNSSLAVNQKIDVVDGAAVTFVADSVSIIRKTGKTLITTGENGGVTLIKIDDGIYWLVGDLTNV